MREDTRFDRAGQRRIVDDDRARRRAATSAFSAASQMAPSMRAQ